MDRLIGAEGNSIIPDSFHAIEGTFEVFNLSAATFRLCEVHLYPRSLGSQFRSQKASGVRRDMGSLEVPMVPS